MIILAFFLNYHQRLVSITKNCLHVNHAQKNPTVILRFVTRNGYQLLLYFICDIYKMTYKLQTIENFTFYFVIFKMLFFSRWTLVRVVTRLNERAFFINKKRFFSIHFFKTLNLKLNQFLSQKACFENKNDFTLQ